MLVTAAQSCLVVVDVQERLAPAIHGGPAAAANCEILVRAANRLAVPILVTEQYPRGLGHTIPSLAALIPAEATVEKMHFCAAFEPAFRDRFEALQRGQAIVCGMEAHVCMMQTALGLKQAGHQTFVVSDASGSRDPTNHAAAMARLAANEVEIVSTEMVVFEWLGQAGTDEFRELLRLLK